MCMSGCVSERASDLVHESIFWKSTSHVYCTVTLRILVGSISYTDGGRYYVEGDYGKKLYGAFAGPV